MTLQHGVTGGSVARPFVARVDSGDAQGGKILRAMEIACYVTWGTRIINGRRVGKIREE